MTRGLVPDEAAFPEARARLRVNLGPDAAPARLDDARAERGDDADHGELEGGEGRSFHDPSVDLAGRRPLTQVNYPGWPSTRARVRIGK